jgi:deoxyribodipyrimidine photo-lyase
MQSSHFPHAYNDILERVRSIDPEQYAITRNFINGAVTMLSPYLSRGVITARQVMDDILLRGYSIEQCHKLLQELAWREYYQRVWQYLEDDMFEDIRNRYTGIQHARIPLALVQASTGIEAIDKSIQELYATGYMHNHLRMYTASISCNVARAHWQQPSKWMYYHLLDGDLASNSCSWQWVAGTFSSKQYFCNQENINRYTGSAQTGTFLDQPYESLPLQKVPESLQSTVMPELNTTLPLKTLPVLDHQLPLLLYNSYNLDPLWRNDMPANRILLLEPSFFKQFPVSEKVISFILKLAGNIQGLQVFTGEIADIPGLGQFPAIYSKEHPAFRYYPGKKDQREWMFPDITGYHPSFFSFWKKCERILQTQYKKRPELVRA